MRTFVRKYAVGEMTPEDIRRSLASYNGHLKVTVKKGLKKGTYKVKVKVTAPGDSNYKKAVKQTTFKIRVK